MYFSRYVREVFLWIAMAVFSLSFYSQADGSEFAKVSVPIDQQKWLSLSYKNIPPNTVTFSKAAIGISVNSSAGPLVHKLAKSTVVNRFSLKGSYSGEKKIENEGFDEDSVLRVGLVAEGVNTLSGIKRMFAPEWIKTLFSLASDGQGLDKIYFYSITNRKSMVGKHRIHPSSQFISESIEKLATAPGDFEFNVVLSKPIDVLALWISVDGDDTKSKFLTTISHITLNQ